MRIFQEEVFGPFVIISSFKTEEEALERANNSTFGLGSAVFTSDLVRAHRIARNIEAGMVWINSTQDSDFRIPFGGESTFALLLVSVCDGAAMEHTFDGALADEWGTNRGQAVGYRP